MELTEIFNKYKTDKGTIGHGSETHNYGPMYEKHLAPLKEKPIKLLEIGILKGNSLRSWRDYFTNGIIVGVDNQEHRLFKEEGVTTIFGDADNPSQLASIVKEYGPFDIIIDDGSHYPKHQQQTLSALFDQLTSGGLYFIEDLHTERLARGNQKQLKFWNIEYFSDGSSNTTLEFFLNIIFNKTLRSQFLSDDELMKLGEQIEAVDMFYPKLGMIRKKSNAVLENL